jgi:hypothetical protein
MLDRVCWTLTLAAVLQDIYDDRIYFADPDKLDAITIDVFSKRTGSPAYIRSLIVPYGHNNYTKIYCVPLCTDHCSRQTKTKRVVFASFR